MRLSTRYSLAVAKAPICFSSTSIGFVCSALIFIPIAELHQTNLWMTWAKHAIDWLQKRHGFHAHSKVKNETRQNFNGIFILPSRPIYGENYDPMLKLRRRVT